MNTVKHIVLYICLILPVLLNGQKSDNSEPVRTAQVQGPSMTFSAPNIDIGQIKRGDKKEMKFQFTNTGTEDLKIEIVSGCECTTLDWPRTAIKPNGTGYITALFDSTEKEKSETVDIDINLENIDPKSGYQMFERVTYTFELLQK